ncbi:unnamed protein product [Trichobilharzia szidati]|nr:unnamed protein product [Trichobilharzia szidati]
MIRLLKLFLLINYLLLIFFKPKYGQMFDSQMDLSEVMNEAQRRSSKLTSSDTSDSTSSDDDSDRIFKFYTAHGKSDRKTKSNDFAHKRFEGDFYSRGYSRYGDVDTESTTFKYAGIMRSNGRKRRTSSDRDTIGSSNRYNYKYFKDNFKIKAKSRNYQREDDSETMEAQGEKTRLQGEMQDSTSLNEEGTRSNEKVVENERKDVLIKEDSEDSEKNGGIPRFPTLIPNRNQE